MKELGHRRYRGKIPRRRESRAFENGGFSRDPVCTTLGDKSADMEVEIAIKFTPVGEMQ